MKLSTKLGNKIIEFDVKYSNRKTFAIQIEPTEKISVYCPIGLSEYTIIEKFKSKAKWINKKLLDFQKIGYIQNDRNFVDGELFMYLGRDYSLQFQLNKRFIKPKIILDNFNENLLIISPMKEKQILKKALQKWYREEAERIILNRLDVMKSKFNYQNIEIEKMIRQIKIKDQKKRWGSCTYKGNLLFNWRIIMAPYSIIDYLIVHEMSHLIHRNHSKNFWKMVETILPDYKKRKKWLKDYGLKMDF